MLLPRHVLGLLLSEKRNGSILRAFGIRFQQEHVVSGLLLILRGLNFELWSSLFERQHNALAKRRERSAFALQQAGAKLL